MTDDCVCHVSASESENSCVWTDGVYDHENAIVTVNEIAMEIFPSYSRVGLNHLWWMILALVVVLPVPLPGLLTQRLQKKTREVEQIQGKV